MTTDTLTPGERSRLIEEIKINCIAHMFGDGMEEDYVLNGFPDWKGLLNMSNDELLLEYGHYSDSDDTHEKRVAAFRKELADDTT